MTGRRIAAAFLGALALGGAAAAAQTQDPNTVGNPQLKSFELPGTTTVPAPEPAPPTTAPAPTPPAPTAEPRPEVPAPEAAPPRPQAAAPERRAPARAPAVEVRPAPAAAAPAPPPAPAAPLPAPADLQEALPLPPVATAPPVAAPAPQAPVAEEQSASFPWAYLGVALLLGLLAYAGYRRPKRSPRQPEQFAPEAEAAEPAAVVAAEPVPAAAAAPPPNPEPASDAGLIGVTLRPWLEIEFRPDRAVATLTDASVQFELVIRNVGNAPARNIRVESAIFNAGPDQEREIADWYAEPIRERTAPALPLLPPREEVATRSIVTIPKDQVREINIGGRSLFIPTVAFNVAYDWGANRQGQTSLSYVVGREAETPSEKMGAFRLDLGPRLYRSVGQRQTRLARIV